MTRTEPLIMVATRGHRRLRAVAVREGRDLVVTVSGGDLPHVGCVVLAVPRERGGASSSVLTLPPHKEEALARPMAETLAAELGAVTVVSAGVHENGATPPAIQTWLDLARELTRQLLQTLTHPETSEHT